MDGSLAIEDNRAALKRIVATLVDMAGLADGPHPEVRAEGEPRRTIPRILWRAILALLRPAESAARRLIIAASRGLVVPLPPLREPKPSPETTEPHLRKRGIAVVLPPPGPARTAFFARLRGRTTTQGGEPRTPAFPLFDPPRRFALYGGRHKTVPPHLAPRICVPGVTERVPLPPPPAPDDLVGATRLCLRLAALAAALDDLPGQARRYARLRSRRGPGERRNWPIRRGRPPGGRLLRFDPGAVHPRNIREVDEILAHAHALALYALEYPDTS